MRHTRPFPGPGHRATSSESCLDVLAIEDLELLLDATQVILPVREGLLGLRLLRLLVLNVGGLRRLVRIRVRLELRILLCVRRLRSRSLRLQAREVRLDD